MQCIYTFFSQHLPLHHHVSAYDCFRFIILELGVAQFCSRTHRTNIYVTLTMSDRINHTQLSIRQRFCSNKSCNICILKIYCFRLRVGPLHPLRIPTNTLYVCYTDCKIWLPVIDFKLKGVHVRYIALCVLKGHLVETSVVFELVLSAARYRVRRLKYRTWNLNPFCGGFVSVSFSIQFFIWLSLIKNV